MAKDFPQKYDIETIVPSLIAIVVVRQWNISWMDVNNSCNEEIFMVPPPGIHTIQAQFENFANDAMH